MFSAWIQEVVCIESLSGVRDIRDAKIQKEQEHAEWELSEWDGAYVSEEDLKEGENAVHDMPGDIYPSVVWGC